jgi:16S rRNA (uracil1498-N3)-methyltransferase
MKRFYSNTLPVITDSDSRHAAKTLRCKTNDIIEVIDGHGKIYDAIILSIGKNEIQLTDIVLKKEEENKQILSSAIAPTKNPSRMEWFVEKATEIGIKQIFPMRTKRTEKLGIKAERLNNIMISAIKQSGQLYLPALFPLQSIEEIIAQTHHIAQKFIAHCSGNNQELLQNVCNKSSEVLVFIGPEGDFTPEEINLCRQNNFKEISLGASILRTETAGVYTAAVINSIKF